MSLPDDPQQLYQNMLAVTKADIEKLDQQIEEELAKVKDRLAELQNNKKAARQLYDGICLRLGIPNDLEEEEGEEEGSEF